MWLWCYTFMLLYYIRVANYCDSIYLPSGQRGDGGFTISHPDFLNNWIWWHGLSGFDNTRPGPIMLNVASICMGFGSLKLIVWTRIPRGARWRRIHSIPIKFVTCNLKSNGTSLPAIFQIKQLVFELQGGVGLLGADTQLVQKILPSLILVSWCSSITPVIFQYYTCTYTHKAKCTSCTTESRCF